MRTIDADALKKDLNMAENCDECPTNWKECEYDTVYSKKDFCQWLDDAPTIEPEQTMISDYFKTMQKCCKYYTYSCDWYAGQKMVDACHHRANIPSGDSWGECSEAHCPFLRKEKTNE